MLCINMQCIDVTWHHNDENEPIRLVSELGSNRYELRKLEFFKNSEVGFAFNEKSNLGTRLGEAPVPLLEEINSDPQFTGKVISRKDFEELWGSYVQ